MFAKFILISAILTVVYMRSFECCESQTSSLLDMNARPTKTVEKKLTAEYKQQENWQTSHATVTSPQVSDIIGRNQESMHHGTKHPKTRATNYKQDEQIDLRAGCCG